MNDDRKKLGQVFVEHKLVTEDQVQIALRRQKQQGGKIGSILLELGFLKSEDLLDFLGKHFSVPSADIYKITITPDVLRVFPLDKMEEFRAIPVAIGAKNIFMLMADPSNEKTLANIAYHVGKNVQPVVAAQTQLDETIEYLKTFNSDLKLPLAGADVERHHKNRAALSFEFDLKSLIAKMTEAGGSFLLLTAGVSPSIKKDNEIIRLNSAVLTPDLVKSFAYEIMTDEQKREFEKCNDIDFGIMSNELGRLRVNVFRQRNSVSIAIKLIDEDIPTIESLSLPQWLNDFSLMHQGLVLITSPSGNGKSATLAALVDSVNSSRKCNIITIEDPIEYLHKHKLSNVNQREVGRDTDSFTQGLRRIFRQAPDVVVIGEMRDPDSFAIALQAARSGMLVLSTIHANNTTSAIERIVESFPSDQQQQIRVQLAESFLLIFSQRLVMRMNGKGRIPVYEKLVNSGRVKNLIREGKTHHIRTVLQSADDFESMDSCLARYVKEGKIAAVEAIKYSENPNNIKSVVGR